MDNIIYKYTREDALNDGVLVDVTEKASQVGFKYPVAITSALHEAINDIPEKYSYEDYDGRLGDILAMAIVALSKEKNCSRIDYKVILHHGNEPEKPAEIKMLCHGGDKGEPVITAMFQGED